MKIYLAGPLYSTAEREFNVRLAAALKANGHIVWLPQKREKRRWTARKIFKKDVEGIDWADVVVANMDGPDPDSGTAWECGYAYGKKPVSLPKTIFERIDGVGRLESDRRQCRRTARSDVYRACPSQAKRGFAPHYNSSRISQGFAEGGQH